jgi:ADP-heptose:LPS heptosyltransferase/predicted SAM-dependent methyltransferase
MVWRLEDPQGDEAAKVKYDVVRYTRGAVLDFGCGPRKAFPQWLGVDSCKDTELFGIEIHPNLKVDISDPAAIAENFQPESVDAIFSSHTLEHIEAAGPALLAWWSLIKVGGHLCLYLPHRDLYPQIGQPGANADHKHDFTPLDIENAMQDVAELAGKGWELVVNETRDQDREYSFLQVYRKREGPGCGASYMQRHAKSVLVIRHGGIGDQLQAAYLLPELKREGFHVTVLTTPDGQAPIAHDPHVDEWFLVDKDQVPNNELGYFWRSLEKYYDRIVNLNESVEGAFLALPGRINFMWPHEVRHKRLNVNYAEHAADLAQIPFKPEGKFYPTTDEIFQATNRKRDIRARLDPPARSMFQADPPWFFIMWTLAGSSPHKFTPWQDGVIGAILARLPRAIVILTGDVACKILEAGLEHPRIVPLSGELTVRETLALAQQMDLVIGPETGVLNAVCYEAMPKVVMLSHSSWENLTRHWVNTYSIPGKAPCYPCHRLHLDATFCPRDPESHAAICQVNVDPGDIYKPIDSEYTAWAKVQMLRESVRA